MSLCVTSHDAGGTCARHDTTMRIGDRVGPAQHRRFAGAIDDEVEPVGLRLLGAHEVDERLPAPPIGAIPDSGVGRIHGRTLPRHGTQAAVVVVTRAATVVVVVGAPWSVINASVINCWSPMVARRAITRSPWRSA